MGRVAAEDAAEEKAAEETTPKAEEKAPVKKEEGKAEDPKAEGKKEEGEKPEGRRAGRRNNEERRGEVRRPLRRERDGNTGETAGKNEPPEDIKNMTNASYLNDLAQVHLRYGALDRAEEMFNKALEHAKDDREKAQTLEQLGNLYQRRGEHDKAVGILEKSLENTTDPARWAQSALRLADLYQQAEQTEKAEALLTKLQSMPADGENSRTAWVSRTASQRLLQLWRKMPGRIEEITKEAEEKVKADPKDLVALERLSEIYTSIDRKPERAAEVLATLIELKPDDTSTAHRLASTYRQLKQYDQAIALYEKMAEGAPAGSRASYSYQVAQLLMTSGKKDEAVSYAEKHLAADAENSSNLSLLASLYEQSGMNDRAEETYVKMAEGAKIERMKGDYILRAAECARKRKDFKAAETYIRKALEMADDKNRSVKSKANLALVRLYEEQGRADELKIGKDTADQPKAPTPAPKEEKQAAEAQE